MNYTPIGRLQRAVAMVVAVGVAGTIGYRLFGLGFTDAAYQTVTTITTLGFRELHDFNNLEQWFTIVIIITGVSTVLYTFTLAVQVVVEGQLRDFLGRRMMDREINKLTGHTVVCGWGRVGRAVAEDLIATGHSVVVVDVDADRVVNPQELGAARMASFVARPHVAEFVDVVMHERSLELIAVGTDDDFRRLDEIAR